MLILKRLASVVGKAVFQDKRRLVTFQEIDERTPSVSAFFAFPLLED